VIEEEFDESTQKTRIRTIYRGSKLDSSNAAALEKAKTTRIAVAQQKKEIAQHKARQRVEAVRRAKERKTNPFRLVGLFAAITFLGVCAVIGLRFLYTAL
jgi:hypothetical protein